MANPMRALALCRLGRQSEALEALQGDPGSGFIRLPQYQLVKAICLIQNGQPEAARDAYLVALRYWAPEPQRLAPHVLFVLLALRFEVEQTLGPDRGGDRHRGE